MTTPKTIKLSACPCCGKGTVKPSHAYFASCEDGKWQILCTNCGTSTRWFDRITDAAHRWNTRIATDAETVFVYVDGVYVERVKE